MESESESDQHSEIESEEDLVETGGRDGFADMMSKILNQHVDGKIPVLAKRKTTMMKELEAAKSEKDKIKRQRIERKLKQEKQMTTPDLSTANFERQLKKLATRGVVALFNAIAAAKREAIETANGETETKAPTKATEVSREDVKRMSKENFLSMLKTTTTKSSDRPEVDTSDAKSDAVAKKARSEPEHEQGQDKATNWIALKDDYLFNKSMALKNWDKESSDDNEDDNDGRAGDEQDEEALNMSSVVKDPFGKIERVDNDDDKKHPKKKSSGKSTVKTGTKKITKSKH